MSETAGTVATERTGSEARLVARGVSLMLLVAGVVGSVIGGSVQSLLFVSGFAAIGAFLVWRLPRHPIGWLLIAAGWGLAIASVPLPADLAPIAAGTASAADMARVWAVGSGFGLVFASFVAISVLFPSGRLPTGLPGAIARVDLVVVSVLAVLAAFGPTTNVAVGLDVPNPARLIPVTGIGALVPSPDVLFTSMFVAFIVGVGLLLGRFRTSTGHERQQYRWIVAAIVLIVVMTAIWAVATYVLGFDPFGPTLLALSVAYLAVPVSVAVAILRYRLWEIDRIINRAVVYGAVTAILGGVFAAAIALSQRVFIVATGQSSEAAVILTTLAVATLYTPVRRRVEAIVDRWLKYDQRLFGPYQNDLDRVLELVERSHAARRLAREAVAELGAIGAAVIDGSEAVVGTAGSWPTTVAARVPVDAPHASLAAVLVGPRRDGGPYDPRSLARLAEIARLAALAVRAARE